MRLNYCTKLIFIIGILSFGQTNSKKTVLEDKYESYFDLDRESIYLHLNKSTYIVGDEIWFKGYVYNRKKSIPFKETSNVYVGIYSDKGKQIQKKLFYSKDGVFSGNLSIDSTFFTGNYYIKAYTKWMKNFKEQDEFVQKIAIINRTLPTGSNSDFSYDLQLLPEGGHLLKGVENTVGFKIINQNGKGVAIKKCFLYDFNGNIIKTFDGNKLGFGKFNFTPQNLKDYKLKVILDNNKDVDKILPKPEAFGINMSVTNIPSRDVIITFRTNDGTLNSLKKYDYKLLVHKDGKHFSHSFSFSKSELSKTIILKRETLMSGVNIATVFDKEDNPILERLFFNNKNIEYPKISVEAKEFFKDSLRLKIKVLAQKMMNKNISISILPKGSLSYNHSNNIFSEFLLKPYIKSPIENPKHYFTGKNRQKEYDLDLLLLTQGWSRYNWYSIFKEPIIINRKFETGISLLGTINNINDKKNKPGAIIVYPSEHIPSDIIKLDDRNSFNISNVYVGEHDTLRLSVLNKKGKPFKPKIVITEKTVLEQDGVDLLFTENLINPSNNLINSKTENNLGTIPEDFLKDKVELLEEVVVEAEAKKSLEATDISDSFILHNMQKITKKEIDMYGNSLIEYLRFKGFWIGYTNTGIPIITGARGPNSIFGSTAPLIYVNDVVTDPSLGFLFLGFPLSQVEKVLIDKIGSSGGVRGSNGVIKIYTRLTPIGGYGRGKKYSERKIFSKKMLNTFTSPKKYYTPRYSSYENSTYTKYGVVHWVNNITTNNFGEATFNIAKPSINDVTLYIEGMGADGSLISNIQSLSFNQL